MPKTPRLRRLRSAHLLPILRFVHTFRAVTGAMIIREFLEPPKAPQYLRHLLSSMVEHGYLEARLVFPRKGTASPLAYQLAPSGMFRLTGDATKTPRTLDGHELIDALQRAETLRQRFAEGWTLVPATEAWPVLRAYTVRASFTEKGRVTRSDRAKQVEATLVGTPRVPAYVRVMRHDLLVRYDGPQRRCPDANPRQEPTGCRIVVQVPLRRHAGLDLAGLPKLFHLMDTRFEVVAPTADRRAHFEKLVAAKVKAAGPVWEFADVTLEASVPPFAEPKRARRGEGSRRGKKGAPPESSLRPPCLGWEPWLEGVRWSKADPASAQG